MIIYSIIKWSRETKLFPQLYLCESSCNPMVPSYLLCHRLIRIGFIGLHSSQQECSWVSSSCWLLHFSARCGSLCCLNYYIELITFRYFKAWPKFLWCCDYHLNLMIYDFLYYRNYLCPDYWFFFRCSRHGLYCLIVCPIF